MSPKTFYLIPKMALVGFLGGLLLGLLDLYPFMIPLQEVITHAQTELFTRVRVQIST